MKQEASDLVDKLKEYISVRLDILKLTAADGVSNGIAKAVVGSVLLVLSLFFILFLSFAVGFYISDRMDNSYSGFFFVTLFYLIVAVIVFLSRKSIEKPIINGVIKSFLATKPEDKNEIPS